MKFKKYLEEANRLIEPKEMGFRSVADEKKIKELKAEIDKLGDKMKEKEKQIKALEKELAPLEKLRK